ncbi:histidine--tRNA ligase [Candidatus Anaplasma sp. TIGMIC]|uniref:histidine--tRNA ligase n=1 Tax=Candidatus Anaplasma sp. TIGMIC TaxID=3020713 RepID=UPI00232EEC93|nr:histidine--tRNA ligase [Candidatus Anaplasma sp. TIGMIC]MDB1135119.1 histidine--tRNA ligase [Candidatus Anaplasma sp. TIGMIC]
MIKCAEEGKFRPVRGTKDLLPDDFYKFDCIRAISQEIGERFGFLPVQTPIFEAQDVFSKTLGDSTDIIGKEMYTFTDRGGDVLTLRPEFTAAITRLFLTSGMTVPVRLFTSGPVFRYERPQKCRQRQFHQINYEFFGAIGSGADAEIISLAHSILKALGIDDRVTLEINSLGAGSCMGAYKDSLVKYFEKHSDGLSEDSKRRLYTNPLRILDTKDPGDISILQGAPCIEDFYDEDTRHRFCEVKDHLTNLAIPYVVNNKLVRGLDYYNGVVFEFKTEHLGAQDAVIAGGRYDRLVSLMGGEDVPAVGFAGGMERLAALMDGGSQGKRFCVAIVPICDEVMPQAMRMAYDLRLLGLKVAYDHVAVRLKTGLKRADKQGADVVLILGDDELRRGSVTCKHMVSGRQEEVKTGDIKAYLGKMAAELPK